MSPIITNLFNTSWESYITDLSVDNLINGVTISFGILYILAALAVVLYSRLRKLSHFVIVLGIIGLTCLFLLEFKAHFYQLPNLMEHALQWMTPIFFLLYWKQNGVTDRLVLWMKIAIALTFIGHGLYALNVCPRPGHFIQMLLSTFPISEDMAILILNFAGIMDILVGISLFIGRKAAVVGLWYAFIWGLLTSLARLGANVSLEDFGPTFAYWWHEAIYRVPHFSIPFFLIHYYRSKQEVDSVLK